MAGPGSVQILHLLDLVVLVGDQQGDRAAQRHALPHAAENIDGIGFDPLPAAPAVAALPPTQFGIDQIRRDSTPAGNPSTRANRALPCDSPAVKYRNILLSKRLRIMLERKQLLTVTQFYPDLPVADRAVFSGHSGWATGRNSANINGDNDFYGSHRQNRS